MSELIVCRSEQELYDAWLGAIGEQGECQIVTRSPGGYPTFLTLLYGETTVWEARLHIGLRQRRHALGMSYYMALTLKAQGDTSSPQNRYAFAYRYRDHADLPGILEKVEGWSQMDLMLEWENELIHFPGWCPLELTDEATRTLRRHGVLKRVPSNIHMYSTMSWEMEDAHCNSTLVIPLHACYPRYRVVRGEMGSVEESRVALASERRFLDTWELLERTIFSKTYLQSSMPD